MLEIADIPSGVQAALVGNHCFYRLAYRLCVDADESAAYVCAYKKVKQALLKESTCSQSIADK